MSNKTTTITLITTPCSSITTPPPLKQHSLSTQQRTTQNNNYNFNSLLDDDLQKFDHPQSQIDSFSSNQHAYSSQTHFVQTQNRQGYKEGTLQQQHLNSFSSSGQGVSKAKSKDLLPNSQKAFQLPPLPPLVRKPDQNKQQGWPNANNVKLPASSVAIQQTAPKWSNSANNSPTRSNCSPCRSQSPTNRSQANRLTPNAASLPNSGLSASLIAVSSGISEGPCSTGSIKSIVTASTPANTNGVAMVAATGTASATTGIALRPSKDALSQQDMQQQQQYGAQVSYN